MFFFVLKNLTFNKFHFKELIPLGCCKSVLYSNEYLKSYECKLLGLSDKVNIFQSISDSSDNDTIDNNSENQKDPQANNNLKNVYSDLNEYILMDLIIKPKCFNSANSNKKNDLINFLLINTSLIDIIDERNDFNIVIKTNVNQITQSMIVSFSHF